MREWNSRMRPTDKFFLIKTIGTVTARLKLRVFFATNKKFFLSIHLTRIDRIHEVGSWLAAQKIGARRVRKSYQLRAPR